MAKTPDATSIVEVTRRTRSIYERRFANQASYRDSVWKVLCSQWFSKWVKPSDSVIDLGAGYCEFINNISARHKTAMDLNPETVRRATAGTEVLLHNCAEPWPVQDASLDVVFTSNFLEHLPSKDNVLRALEHAHLALRDNGILIALGPNVRAVPGAYWDFFDHFVPLTERSIAEALSLAGFDVELSIARFLPYSMSTGRQVPSFLLRLYLRCPPAWRLFGKQFLVVARRTQHAA